MCIHVYTNIRGKRGVFRVISVYMYIRIQGVFGAESCRMTRVEGGGEGQERWNDVEG